MPQDQYKALNPRDKKQVRNRIGARRFRAKRKGESCFSQYRSMFQHCDIAMSFFHQGAPRSVIRDCGFLPCIGYLGIADVPQTTSAPSKPPSANGRTKSRPSATNCPPTARRSTTSARDWACHSSRRPRLRRASACHCLEADMDMDVATDTDMRRVAGTGAVAVDRMASRPGWGCWSITVGMIGRTSRTSDECPSESCRLRRLWTCS